MAGIGKFRIPTLDEKEKHDANLTKGIKPLFKNENKSADLKSNPLPKNTTHSKQNASAAQQPRINQGNVTVKSKTTSLPQVDPTSKTVNTGKQQTVTNNAVSKPQQTLPPNGSNKDDCTSKLESEQDVESLPTLGKLGKTNSLIVNQRQRGNPILKHVRNVPWEYGNIVPDYVMGHSTCALFLSLRYHQLNPDYIHKRLKLLGKSFDLRVLLVQVDIKDPHHLLKDLAKMCILADCTLMLAFSPEEAGRYLETYKVYENKPPEAIMEKSENNFMAKVTDCLTTVKSVNKTDCMTLMTTFKSINKVMKATREELSLCPGFGPQKAQRLHDVFHEPFLRAKKRKPVEASEEIQPSTSKSAR